MRCMQDMAYCPSSFGAASEGRPETRRDDAKWVCLALYPCKVPRALSRATPFHEGWHRGLCRKCADSLEPGHDLIDRAA
jgi:hypothetical protein